MFIYLFPALGDIIVSATLFAGSVRVAEMGLSAKAVAGVIAAWAATYMLVNPICGRWLTEQNAGRMLLGASIACAWVSLGFLVFQGLAAIYILTALLAACIAFFFAPFQVFMKHVDQGRKKPLAYSTGIYVFSWSTGFALGPFISGYLWKVTLATKPLVAEHLGIELEGWEGAHVFCLVLALATSAGIMVMLHHLRRQAVPAPPPPRGQADIDTAPNPAAETGGGIYDKLPDRSWLAWTCAGAGVLAIAIIRSVFPKHGQVLGLDQVELGQVFFVISITQALAGYVLRHGTTWMYRPMPLLLFGMAGITGLLLFSCAQSLGLLLTGAICLGIYSGSFYSYYVFHPLIHPVHAARNMAINESIVGFTGLLALGGGALADRFGFGFTYAAAASLVIVAVIVQCVVHRKDAAMIRRMLD